jgi:hypothetical protein
VRVQELRLAAAVHVEIAPGTQDVRLCERCELPWPQMLALPGLDSAVARIRNQSAP